jgi:hypothetical protein
LPETVLRTDPSCFLALRLETDLFIGRQMITCYLVGTTHSQLCIPNMAV